jgi:hypothetical protein
VLAKSERRRTSGVCIKVPPVEAPDWGFARNCRTVLMTPSAEWVQSVYSATFELHGKVFITPNRDYAYEGFLASHGGEHWKFIDSIAIGLRDRQGRYLSLAAAGEGVSVTPWRATYSYVGTVDHPPAAASVPFAVTYRLLSEASPLMSSGSVEILVPASAAVSDLGLTVVVQPFLDIRHMYAGSSFGDYRLSQPEPHSVEVAYGDRRLAFYLSPSQLTLFDSPAVSDVLYKLGTGTREEVIGANGGRETRFVGEHHDIAAYFDVAIPLPPRRALLRLRFACWLASSPRPERQEVEQLARRSRAADGAQLRMLVSAFPFAARLPFGGAILARIAGLQKFKTAVLDTGSNSWVEIPHAGAFWFRTPWYRDVFEGLWNSFKTLMRVDNERQSIREIVLSALRHQHPRTGLVPARLPEFAHQEPAYNSSDATLLCFLVANAYVEATSDLDFARTVMSGALKAIDSFESNGRDPAARRRDGPPQLDAETGLLLSVPQHSWIDTRCQWLEYAGGGLEGLPNRASKRFVKDLYDRLGSQRAVEERLASPEFFLPEINAQWIRMLEGLAATMGQLAAAGEPGIGADPETQRRIAALAGRARHHFKLLFWDEERGFLFNLVDGTGTLRDPIECESAVTVAGILGDSLFTRPDLGRIWRCAQRTLLVHRRLQLYGDQELPFGLIARNDDERIYYDDNQYHSDVVWPRSTPYLIRLLTALGEDGLVRDLLVNTLDHQMSEAAIFYNQELFSRPCGNNPAAGAAASRNPVPVKNPIQFWSQWCDAFIEAFENEDR